MRMQARIPSLLLLLSSLWLLCAPVLAGDAERLAREKCPGLAIWEARHLKTQASEKTGIPTLPSLRARLLAMEQRDQKARDKFVQERGSAVSLAELVRVDAENLKQLKRILRKYGVPDVSQVGRDGMGSLWLLTQHASADVGLQKLVLGKLKDRRGDIDTAEIAMLTDRILLGEGKPQVYGTQFHEVHGKLVPYKIKDEKSVDARRAKMGLMPLADYQCAMNVSPPPEDGDGQTGSSSTAH